MKEIKSVHRTVARYLALGIPLSNVCESLGLNLSTWRQISAQELFKAEVKRIEGEIESQFVEEQSSDPVFLELKAASRQAAKRLTEEVNNFDPDTGASAATRIKAATSVLDRIGLTGVTDQRPQTMINIQISQAKADLLAKQKEREKRVQPNAIGEGEIVCQLTVA